MGPTISKVSSYSYNASIQDVKNITQFNSQILCNASCTNEFTNVFIVIENSTVGDINVVQECETNLDCYQQNDIEIINNVQVTNTQTAEAKASNELKGPIPYIGLANVSNITAKTRNWSVMASYNATYININMNCVSTSYNQIDTVFLIIKDTETGDINFTQKGAAATSCQSINSAKVSNSVSLVNNQTAKSEASNSVGGLGLAGLIVLLVIAGIVIAGLKAAGNKDKSQQQKPITPPPGQIRPNVPNPPIAPVGQSPMFPIEKKTK